MPTVTEAPAKARFYAALADMIEADLASDDPNRQWYPHHGRDGEAWAKLEGCGYVRLDGEIVGRVEFTPFLFKDRPDPRRFVAGLRQQSLALGGAALIPFETGD